MNRIMDNWKFLGMIKSQWWIKMKIWNKNIKKQKKKQMTNKSGIKICSGLMAAVKAISKKWAIWLPVLIGRGYKYYIYQDIYIYI